MLKVNVSPTSKKAQRLAIQHKDSFLWQLIPSAVIGVVVKAVDINGNTFATFDLRDCYNTKKNKKI